MFTEELILEAAKLSAGKSSPIAYMNGILGNWKNNGVFDTDTLRPLKTYHVFSWFDTLYTLGNELASKTDAPDVYVTAAKKDGKWGAMISYYTPETDAAAKEIEITVDGAKQMSCSLLDGTYNAEVVDVLPAKAVITVQPNTVLFLANL